MQFLKALLLTLLPFVADAAKKSSAAQDAFTKFHTKQLAAAPVKLDDSTFNQLTALPRNHSVAVVLTALEPRIGCALCRDFAPEWELLAKSWVRGDRDGKSKVVFATLDFADGKNTFQAMQLNTAPLLLVYPPTVGPNAKPDGQPARYEFTSGPQSAEIVHQWVSKALPGDGPHPAVHRPLNYVKIVTTTTIVLGVLTTLFVAAPYALPLLQNRNLWAAISLFTILLFCSGHMFNHIRASPYVGQDGKGGISYFAGGFQNQFGLESQIVGAIYAILTLSTISLGLKVPRMKDPKYQQVAVIVWVSIMLGTYSFLLSTFRTKNGGYPFWLPPF